MRKRIGNTEDVPSVLARIAKSYPKNSIEYRAIEIAGFAHVFLKSHTSLKSTFERYMANVGKKLSKTDQKILRDMGIGSD